MERIYIVVREDLEPGLRMAQACHAATLYGVAFGARKEQNLIVLGVPNKEVLARLLYDAQCRRCRTVHFCEPDIGNELTAIACCEEARPLLSNLPLAFRAAKVDGLPGKRTAMGDQPLPQVQHAQ